jgi:cell division protein FtsB
MRIFKYLLGIWAAIAVYALFLFLAGPKGISAYNYLLSEKDQQWANIRELGLLNEDLERTRNNLIYDHDTLLVQARQMGYGHENERFIRIVGLSNIRTIPAEVGTVYFTQKPDFFPEKNIKIAALIIGFLLFAFLFMMELIERRTR